MYSEGCYGQSVIHQNISGRSGCPTKIPDDFMPDWQADPNAPQVPGGSFQIYDSDMLVIYFGYHDSLPGSYFCSVVEQCKSCDPQSCAARGYTYDQTTCGQKVTERDSALGWCGDGEVQEISDKCCVGGRHVCFTIEEPVEEPTEEMPCQDNEQEVVSQAANAGMILSCRNTSYCVNDSALVALGAPEGWFVSNCKSSCCMCEDKGAHCGADSSDGGSGSCQDLDNPETEDSQGSGCVPYSDNPQLCGDFDDDDFTADQLCCACGGGEDNSSGSGEESFEDRRLSDHDVSSLFKKDVKEDLRSDTSRRLSDRKRVFKEDGY